MSDTAPRHQQRERALALLYEAELKGEDPRRVVDALAVAPDPYVRTLLHAAATTREEAERRIAAASVGWPLELLVGPVGALDHGAAADVLQLGAHERPALARLDVLELDDAEQSLGKVQAHAVLQIIGRDCHECPL